MGICYVPYKLPYLPKAGYLNPAADDMHSGAPLKYAKIRKETYKTSFFPDFSFT